MLKTKVVILAAGKGTRMKAEVPKPLVQIAGKPMIAHLLERIAESGLDKKPVVVVSAENIEIFKATLGDAVEYAVQTEQLGTAHALRSAEAACGDAECVIVLYGDHPFLGADVIRSLQELVAGHEAPVVMLTAKVPNFEGAYEVFKAWGRIVRDVAGKVQGIVEAKEATPEQLAITEINPAMFAFPGPWIWSALREISNNNAKGEYYLTDIIEIAQRQGKEIVTASVDAMQVMGVNTPEELKLAEKLHLEQD